ncbi:hypothetical protein Mapa_006904 [Marchantia paleacea]|nr:hypothetical protein Mapa_006904 [Marchantia paleacea]
MDGDGNGPKYQTLHLYASIHNAQTKLLKMITLENPSFLNILHKCVPIRNKMI